MQTPWDCVVVGGGAAGLSAGLVLGRARVFAAGDVSPKMPQVAAAIAAGSLAAAAVVQSLLSDDYGLPVPKWREHVDA